jgi:hypothetical protein
MTESASVKVLSAEIRVLQVGNGEITRSMYRQLDGVSLERFEASGRVKDNKVKSGEGVLQLVGRDTRTAALVRHDPQPPDWSAVDGPSEFAHWLLHTDKTFGSRARLREARMDREVEHSLPEPVGLAYQSEETTRTAVCRVSGGA